MYITTILILCGVAVVVIIRHAHQVYKNRQLYNSTFDGVFGWRFFYTALCAANIHFCVALWAASLIERPRGSLDAVVRPNTSYESKSYAAQRTAQLVSLPSNSLYCGDIPRAFWC